MAKLVEAFHGVVVENASDAIEDERDKTPPEAPEAPPFPFDIPTTDRSEVESSHIWLLAADSVEDEECEALTGTTK